MAIIQTTIQGLRTFSGTPNVNDVYYVTDIGMEGNWYYDGTSSLNDNLGTILTAGWNYTSVPPTPPSVADFQFKRVYDNGAVYVEWFGAVGNGITDDTKAIQNALISLYPDGGELIFLNLNYIVTTLNLVPNITIYGNGATLKQKSGTTNSAIFYCEKLVNVKLIGINFDGNKTNVTGNLANAIDLSGCKDIILENLNFYNIRKRAIFCSNYLTSGINCERISILNCKANNLGTEGLSESEGVGSFIDCDLCNDIKINNVEVNDIYGVIAIIVRTENFEINNFKFNTCTFDNGLSFANCKNLKISNGIIEDMLRAGIEINGTKNFTIDNIDILNCRFHGIIIATYVHLPYIDGELSQYGSINNTKIKICLNSNHQPINCLNPENILVNYTDILISSSQYISMTNITSNYLVRISNAVIKGNNINSEFVSLKNSLLNNLALQYTSNITLTNNSISNINNTNSSYALVKNANQFDLFFKSTVAHTFPNNQVSFALPVFDNFVNSNALDCGLVNGFVTIDNGFESNPIDQFTTKIYHVRSIITAPIIIGPIVPWASNLISTLNGLVARNFDARFEDNKIIVENISGVDTIVRVRLDAMLDKWY